MNDKKPVVNYFGDSLSSCLVPCDLHWEHRAPNHNLVFVRTGKLIIEERNGNNVIEAGENVFVRRNCTVNINKVPDGDIPYSAINISLSRKALREYYSTITQRNFPRVVEAIKKVAYKLPHSASLESLIQSTLPYVDAGECPSSELLDLKVREAILCLLSIDRCFYPTLFDFNEAWKIGILEFMEQNFTEDLSLEEFAVYTGRSLSTFKRDFAKISDLSPQRWIIERRLQLAHKLLEQGRLSATEVASQVGFKNRSHFSTAFKQYFGYVPGVVKNR